MARKKHVENVEEASAVESRESGEDSETSELVEEPDPEYPEFPEFPNPEYQSTENQSTENQSPETMSELPDTAAMLDAFSRRAEEAESATAAATQALTQAREILAQYEASMAEIDARFRDEAVMTEQHRLRADAAEAASAEARLATALANDNRLAADHHAASLATDLAYARASRDKAIAQVEAVRAGCLYQVVTKKNGQTRRLLILAANVVDAAVRARDEGVESDAIENMSRVADRVVV